MDELVVMPERTLMIGDTHYDMQMAKNARVHAAAVTYGAQSTTHLSAYKPEQMFHQFNELSTWLLSHDD